MAFKIENSHVYVKFWNHLKISIQASTNPHNRSCKFEVNQTSSILIPNVYSFKIYNIYIKYYFNNITFMHMLKIATVDKNLSFRVKGQKTEGNAFFSVTHIETTSVHPFPALWNALALPSMEKISGQSNLFP